MALVEDKVAQEVTSEKQHGTNGREDKGCVVRRKTRKDRRRKRHQNHKMERTGGKDKEEFALSREFPDLTTNLSPSSLAAH